jgi:hypothetical protein
MRIFGKYGVNVSVSVALGERASLRLPEVFFNALEHLKSNPHSPRERLSVKTSLVVRESTGPAPRRLQHRPEKLKRQARHMKRRLQR